MTLSKICAEGKRRKEGGVNVKIQGKHGKEESPEYFLFLFNDKGFLNSEWELHKSTCPNQAPNSWWLTSIVYLIKTLGVPREFVEENISAAASEQSPEHAAP